MYKISILSALLFFSSCTNSKETKEKNVQIEDTYTLKYKRTVKLPLDTLTDASAMGYQHFVDNGKNYYAQLNESINEIYVFDYDNQKLAFRIALPKDDKEKIQQPRGFHIHTFDSIFVPSTINQTMFLLNREGKIIKKYPYREKHNSSEIFEYRFFASYYNVFVIAQKLYCIGARSSRSVLDINTGKWEHHKEIPKKFDEGIWVGNYYLDTYQIYNAETKKKYFSYANTDYIYEFAEDKKNKMYAGSKYFTENAIKPFPKGNTKIPFETLNLKYLQTPSYRNFIKDLYRNLYYRIANFPMTDEDIKNASPKNRRKKHSIIIMNKEMNKVGEIDLPKYEYGYDIMCTKEGINIINRKKTNQDENAIYYDVFELVEKGK